MATPLTADQLVRALRAEGVTVIEVPGWRQNNRNHKGPWGPVHGNMLHHTVTGPTVNGVSLCFNGHSTLPGPLCHGVIRRDGTVHLVGNGRANHAGGGDPAVLQAVTAETYTTRPPLPRKHDGSDGAADGNRAFYGWECENLGDGRDPWPPAQVEAMVRVSAALSRAHGWREKSTIGHLEWSDWKSDPKGPDNVVSMPSLRTRIATRLTHPANWTPGTPAPKPPVEDTVAITNADVERIALATQAYRNKKADEASVKAGHGRIPDAYGYLVQTHQMVAGLVATVAVLTDRINELEAKVS
ncbi:peptidoglycan recognition protein family protein [Streptomyces sp. NPDC003314]